jgi:hypothetical protein
VVTVPENRVDDQLRVAASTQLLGTEDRVRIGMALVVEVVQQPRDPPRLELVPGDAEAMLAVPRDGTFNRESVLAQRVTAGPFAEQLPRVVAAWHRHLPFGEDRSDGS